MTSCQGADEISIAVADFNKDGNLDLFLLQEQILNYHPGAITDDNDPAYAALLARGGGSGAYGPPGLHGARQARIDRSFHGLKPHDAGPEVLLRQGCPGPQR